MNDPVIVSAPSSKSLSHRAVICACLAVGESGLNGVLESDDLMRTMDCMRATGAVIERLAPGRYRVQGVNGTPAGGSDAPVDIDVGESGTTCRLLTAVLAVGSGDFRVFGRGRMHQRPIAELVDVLRSLGVEITYQKQDGCPPFVMRAAGLKGGECSITLHESSQYLSGLLLASPLARRPLTVNLGGDKAVSWPYVGLTLQTMTDFGAAVRVEMRSNGSWQEVDWRALEQAEPGRMRFRTPYGMYMGRTAQVEGDWSNASYLLAAGALGPRAVHVANLRKDSLQGDRAILEILEAMGASVTWKTDGVVLMPTPLRGVDVDMGHCPDLVPTVATVAAFAQGPTHIRNVAHLRIKESDRLQGVADELNRAGATVEVRDDGLAITPFAKAPDLLHEFRTYGDHRMAMSLSLLGLHGGEVLLDNPGCVAKSFPGFWDEWKQLRR